MHVIARSALRQFCREHASARNWLEGWWKVASRATWRNLHEVRATYPAADQFGGCLIFDKGNEFRLIVRVSFANDHTRGTLFVKYFLTHAEYDEDDWKECCE